MKGFKTNFVVLGLLTSHSETQVGSFPTTLRKGIYKINLCSLSANCMFDIINFINDLWLTYKIQKTETHQSLDCLGPLQALPSVLTLFPQVSQTPSPLSNLCLNVTFSLNSLISTLLNTETWALPWPPQLPVPHTLF